MQIAVVIQCSAAAYNSVPAVFATPLLSAAPADFATSAGEIHFSLFVSFKSEMHLHYIFRSRSL
jgi:hypothetical protein